MTLPKFIITMDGVFRLGMVRSATIGDACQSKNQITLTEPPTGKRKQYDKQGEEMTYGRLE